jgi:hypothetical protein
MGNYMSKKSTGSIISEEKYLISESESKLLTSWGGFYIPTFCSKKKGGEDDDYSLPLPVADEHFLK